MYHISFEAWYESGSVVAFENFLSWHQVFSCFKYYARFEGSGELYCRGVLIRCTGRNHDCDYSIYPWYSPVPEPDYGLLDANAMYIRDELAAMEEELALESLWKQYESDCCMCDYESSLRELEPYFDPWGSFDWEGYKL